MGYVKMSQMEATLRIEDKNMTLLNIEGKRVVSDVELHPKLQAFLCYRPLLSLDLVDVILK